MAIDTRNKRASCVAAGLLWLVVPPTPDGSLANLSDRRQDSALYAGDTAPAVPAPPAARLGMPGGVRLGTDIGGVRLGRG